jgi:hypothetical protein
MLRLVWQYIMNWIIFLFDQSLNTLRGGDPGESISVAAAKAQLAGVRWGCVLCKILAKLLRDDHCTASLAKFGKHSLWGPND